MTDMTFKFVPNPASVKKAEDALFDMSIVSWTTRLTAAITAYMEAEHAAGNAWTHPTDNRYLILRLPETQKPAD